MQPVAWSTTLASLQNSHTDYEFSNLITYSHNESWSGAIPELGLTYLTNGNGSATYNGDFTNDSDPRPVGMLQSEGMMVPGQGYWVFMSKGGTYNPSESDGTADGVPIDDSFSGNMTIDEGSTDGESTDVGTPDSVAVDEGSTDGGSTDVGTTNAVGVDEGTTDNGTTDGGTTDDGTSDDIPISD